MTKAKSPNPSESQRLGVALRQLRLRYGLTQKAAAEAAGIFQQTWARYESADNDALLKVTLQRRLAEAMGSSFDEFIETLEQTGNHYRSEASGMTERAPRKFEFSVQGQVRASPQGFQVYDIEEPRTIDLAGLLGPDTRILPVAGESMIPYAYPGGFLSYNLNTPPSRGLGCVIETVEGQFYVKRYDGMRDGKLYVTELFPVERELIFNMEDLRGVYAVGIRSDRF